MRSTKTYFSPTIKLNQKYHSDRALVTGANGGLGLKISLKLAEQGYNIIGTGRNTEALENAKNEVETKYPKVKFEPLIADFSNYEAGVRLVSEKIEDPKYDVKIFIINAGYGIFDPFITLENKKIHDFINTMCTTYAQLAREIINKNKNIIYHSKNDRCLLYFTSSALADMSTPHSALYCAVKAYDSALASHLSIEKYGKNLDITAMQPGLFSNSKFFSRFSNSQEKSLDTGKLFPTSDEVCEYVMKTLGKSKIVDCSANAIIGRVFLWIIGEYPAYLLGKFLANLDSKK
ncbi:hypothetical protein M9Y10_032421 [Tritrichomonas musculus]|uniref:Uncharacterized protein n=1 Tax=Tritrichomonas musculus TaxID=1915356 RepID=A0ABR2GYJ4_9EUKA